VRADDVNQEGELHFIVMEYVDGSNLREIIERTGPMDPLRAAHYLRQAALGLQHAHDNGVLHRNVEPGNVMLGRDGIVKLVGLSQARVTQGAVDGRSDVYSLGATFYFCLIGRPPSPGGTVKEKLISQQTRRPSPIRDLRAEVPEDVAAVVER